MKIMDKLRVALALLLCAASAAASGHVTTYSFRAFNASTTADLVVATNSSVLTPASLLFSGLYPEFNASEGFLLLSDTVNVWSTTGREASFNTSFTVAAATPAVAFVVLLDRYPMLLNPVGLRGPANGAPAEANATSAVAAVEVGAVRSYAPESPNVGLNVTVAPNGTEAVWIEYSAVARRLRVHVAAGGQPRPPRALLDAPLHLAGFRTTQNALVGFFAGQVRDAVVGVSGWELTVERLDGDGRKGTPRWVIVVAVVGAVAAMAAVSSVAVCCFRSRRRASLPLRMEQPKH